MGSWGQPSQYGGSAPAAMASLPYGGPAPSFGKGGGKGGGKAGELTLYEACDSAGRGDTSGNTVQDDEIVVSDPSDRPITPQRFETFESCKQFPEPILEQFRKAGFPAPSQIQQYCWPLAMEGKDVIGIAATGSGKTLAFLLPAFTEMYNTQWRADRQGPGLLVMSPTRELAQQIETEATRFGGSIGMYTVSMYGGAPKRDQMAKYRQGVHCIVACPGRLNDFLEGGQVRLDAVNKLCLDEADRMLDMGFEPQIRKILAKVNKKRQTLFFTATWPREVRKLASEILYQPFKVMIGNRDELKANQDVIQKVRMVEGFNKDKELQAILNEAGFMKRESYGKALVFASTKRMCEQLSNNLYRAGVPCASIHGDKDQSERDNALNGLKTGKIKVLVATDVAARGLDIKGVGLVVNYDAANNSEDYVHRIGRTGRAGAKGFSITFFSSKDGGKAKGVVDIMDRTGQEVPDELRKMASFGGGGDNRSRWGGGGSKGGGSKGGGGGGGGSWGDRGGGGGKGGGGGGGGGWKGGGGGGGGGSWGSNDTPLGGGSRGRSRSPRRW